MNYIRYSLSLTHPHIVVGGLGNPASALVLSNWKDSSTADHLKADLASEIVFNALNQPKSLLDITLVTSDHFNADALVGLWALINVQEALEKKSLLIDVARAGLLEHCQNRDAAKISFVLDAWARHDLSPLKREIFYRPKSEIVSILYEELLPRFDKILSNFDRLDQYWIQEESFFRESEKLFESGQISIEEIEDADLAIIQLPESGVPEGKERRRSSLSKTQLCHVMAVNQRTERSRILLMQGRKYDFYFRPESWINCVSKSVPKRSNLGPLAKSLTGLETDGVQWIFDGIDRRSPHLKRAELAASAVSPDRIRHELTQFLKA